MGFFDIRDIGRIRREKVVRCGIWLSVIVLLTIVMFLLRFLNVNYIAYKVCILVSLAGFICELVAVFLESDRRITPLMLFLIAFYGFQNGQILLWAFGINFNAFYLLYLQEHLNDAIIFTSVCNLWAGFAGMLCSSPRRDLDRVRIAPQDRYDRRLIYRSLGIACVVLGVVIIPMVLAKFAVAMLEGYTGVRALEERIPSVLTFLEYMFAPFCMAFICYFGTQKIGRLAAAVLLGYFALTAFCGDRTTGIAGLFVTLYLFYFLEHDRKKRLRMVGVLAGACVVLLFLLQIVHTVRNQESLGSLSLRLWDVVVDSVWEIGFSFFPLMAMMEIVPASESFLFGRQYLQSVVGGIFPASVDPTGTVAKINAASRVFESWEAEYFSYFDFGLGFSLNAEGYINFGCFGFLSVFLICLLVAFFLNRYQRYEENSVFPKYAACVLLFLWFTLPRRDSYYVWKALVYSVVLVMVYLWLTCSAWRKRAGRGHEDTNEIV